MLLCHSDYFRPSGLLVKNTKDNTAQAVSYGPILYIFAYSKEMLLSVDMCPLRTWFEHLRWLIPSCWVPSSPSCITALTANIHTIAVIAGGSFDMRASSTWLLLLASPLLVFKISQFVATLTRTALSLVDLYSTVAISTVSTLATWTSVTMGFTVNIERRAGVYFAQLCCQL